MEKDMPPAANKKGLTTADYLAAEGKLSDEEKAVLAAHLAATLGANEGFADAEAILRLMTWNAEPRVVEAMAKAAAGNPDTPHSIAWALANDDEAAATLVLEACAALSDVDLVNLVQSSGSTGKMCAIARRSVVSEAVSRSLVDHGDEDAVHTLLANAKAAISDEAYGAALDRFGTSERIQEGIIDRPRVSAPVAERLSAAVSPNLKSRLARKIKAQRPLPGYPEEDDGADWSSAMRADRALTETRLMGELCQGKLEFFARALSALSKAPYADVRASLLEEPPAFAPYWQGAGLVKDWLPVVMAAVTALIQVDESAGKADADLFSRNILARTQANIKTAKITLTDAQKRFFMRPNFR
jgi:hypothetical protein